MPLLCTEREKKKKKKRRDDDDLTEPTLIDGSLGLRHECVWAFYECVCVRAPPSAHSLRAD